MRLRDLRIGPREARAPSSVARQFVAVLLALGMACLPIPAQQSGTRTVTSELATENNSRVAASANQVREVLRKDPGLMVELKRWVAKEATDRGQIVDDSDLTDQAIYDRLTSDLEFRSVATRLVQRYGYLLPKLNPESDAAKEEELLLQARARRLAKKMEEDEEAARPQTAQEERRARSERTGPREHAQERETGNVEPQGREGPQEVVPPPTEQPEGAPFGPGGSREKLRQASRNPIEEPGIPSAKVPQTGSEVELSYPERPSETVLAAALGAAMASDNRMTRMERPPESAISPSFPSESRSSLSSEPRGEQRQRRSYEARTTARGPSAEEPSPYVARANPYADIPSLYDMYQQVSVRPAELKRFGADVFRAGSRDSQMLPMDLPVGPEYVVGPGDGLAVDLWGSVSQRLYRTVDREGRLTLPEVGPVLVSGRTLGEVQQALQKILRTQFRDVSADVSLSRLRTVRVYVVGDADEPGAYDISSLSTPLNALFAAGGPTARGSLRVCRHYRGKQLVQEVDVYDLLLHGVRSDLQRIENGDTVLVPPIGAKVTVEGAVRRPAIYELRTEKTLADVLALAGGILPTATLRSIQVQRVEAHEKRTMMSVEIPETQDNEAITKKLESFAIRDGDEVRIFPIAPYNQDAVFLQGHVLRPGKYSYHPGMKFTDLVTSFAELLPEPAAKYAEIIRLQPPDYQPSVESFNLAAALTHPASAPELRPMDTVRIFSRYDFENLPSVLVAGEVRSPGLYRSSGQMHVRDAVHLAGGLSPDALLDNAQIFRYLPDSRLKIMSINLQEAIAGNPIDNILLQPRDRLVIHRNSAKVDPPSVYIRGEVDNPGRYPLTANMRVEDLIHVSGGLKRSADTDTADLTRYLVQNSKQQTGEHQEVRIAAALAGDPGHNLPLRDGDVLTIRQIPGWNDLGAAATLRGEVGHPGTYGIRPGERLSSVLERAGGFLPTAYPYAAVLERAQVRELEERNHTELIRRVQLEQTNLKLMPETDPDQKLAKEAALQQWQNALENLKANPPTGRLVIKISSDIRHWKGTASDVEVRAGDTLVIPKKPNYVMVTGQVYNPTAITYRPGKSAKWYLGQAGGPTRLANKKAIFAIRADGSTAGSQGNSWWKGHSLDVVLLPGDMVVVPEKAVGGTQAWKTVLQAAQLASSVAIAVSVVKP